VERKIRVINMKNLEEIIASLQEENKKLRISNENQIQYAISFANIVNEMLKYIALKDKEHETSDLPYFIGLLSKVVEDKPKEKEAGSVAETE